MAFDISALAAYTKENQDQLLTATIFKAKTQELIQSEGNVLAGVSSAEQINQLETDAVFQNGGVCGFTSSGTTAFTRRTLTVGKLRVNESLCPKTLKSTYLQWEMKAGSRPDAPPDAPPFEEVYSERKAAKIAKQLEIGLWQGDTASGSANLNKFDGFIKLIDAANIAVANNAIKGVGTITGTTAAATITGTGTLFSSVLNTLPTAGQLIGAKIYGAGSVLLGTVLSVQSDTGITLNANLLANVTGAAFTIVLPTSKNFAAPILGTTGITSSNVVNIMQSIWQTIPADVKGQDDVRIFCGWEVYETFIAALIALNLYTYTAKNDAQQAGEIKLPGTMYTLTAVHGLDNTNRIYAMRTSNMWLGCDVLGEEDKWEIFFAKEADEVRFVVEWKTGVQVALPAEIVHFALA